MSSQQLSQFSVDRYVVIHVATTCDEHGVYVTKDSAEVIELGWILIDASTMEEVSIPHPVQILSRSSSLVSSRLLLNLADSVFFYPRYSLSTRVSLSSLSTLPSLHYAVGLPSSPKFRVPPDRFPPEPPPTRDRFPPLASQQFIQLR